MYRLAIILLAAAISPPQLIAGEEVQPDASVRFANAGRDEVPDFQKHVVPLLGRLGCNGRNCHGSFQGRGGFRLSLFGYDFEMDYAGLSAAATDTTAKRLDHDAPEQSLILQKPLLQVDHEGGERFTEGSWEHHLLRRWIEGGAPDTPAPRELAELIVEPAEVVFADDSNSVQVRVTAVWENGEREEVTPLCRFRTNDDSVVNVDRDGRLTSVGAGDTHVIAFYDNGVVALPVMRKTSFESSAIAQRKAPLETQPPGIDKYVNAKLEKLGIVPSPPCTDAEFLRRASIDLTGTLPTPAEVESFLADTALDKRTRKVEELLERPAYAAWWANKLCDFTGCNPNQQAELGQETSVQWYSWIYQRLRENTPYDELIRRIVLAEGRRDDQTYDEYAAETSAYFREQAPVAFSQRETMPHYWTRRSMREPEDAAQAFAHNFLGIRLQCAQCHKHPFAPWTQDDFKQFSRFFENVTFGVAPESRDDYQQLAERVGLDSRDKQGAAVRTSLLRKAETGGTIPWRELYIEKRSQPAALSLLRSGRVELEGDDDPRKPIMDWMADPENPWFARAIVNRVWAAYFETAIIDPPDDLNPANPPSHPQLLDWLAANFVEHDFDLKWLHRQIVTSQAYQRSWRPNATNREDRRNYSRMIPRRMPAEVVYDSVKQAVAASQQQDEVRLDLTRRAIGHLSMRLAGTYAMQVFGKPDRAVNCDCERVNEPTLLQSIFLQNDPIIDQRLDESGWLAELRAQEAAGEEPEPNELVRAAWLRTVNRPPNEQEAARAQQHLTEAASMTEGVRDLLWALLNTKEFVLIR